MRLIDAKRLEANIKEAFLENPVVMGIMLRWIRKQPTADVAPVVHGQWAHLGGDEWCCSACGFVITTEGSWDKPTKKYCEDCGARMDDDESEAR